jgi:hypothetical protein
MNPIDEKIVEVTAPSVSFRCREFHCLGCRFLDEEKHYCWVFMDSLYSNPIHGFHRSKTCLSGNIGLSQKTIRESTAKDV